MLSDDFSLTGVNVMLNEDVEKNAQQQLKEFLCPFRSFHGMYIPEQRSTELVELLASTARISTTFGKENPLSVMETLTMVLCVLNASDDDIADIFSLSRNTIISYIERVKDKLNAITKMEAVMMVLREGIIKIIH